MSRIENPSPAAPRTLRALPLAAFVAVLAGLAACSSPADTAPGTTGTSTTAGPTGTSGVAGTPAAGTTTGPAATSGTGNGNGNGVTNARACDLLSDADLQEITQSAVIAKTDTAADTIFANFCRWNLPGAEIDLGVVSPGGRAWYDEHVAILNGLQPVSGLPADVAVLQELTGSIFAVKGDTYIDLFTIGVRAPDEDLVRRVLENLGQ
ncbi:MAG TPA: hypothetical protein VFP56_09840 [Candidatus Limnocylindrales bacterium]|nr:hypothetical protein [Candidatus Limnocylindrales bacterium]